nr:Atxe2 family lasso peptide isopeptidase [uncultured Steroidobacter sp.]
MKTFPVGGWLLGAALAWSAFAVLASQPGPSLTIPEVPSSAPRPITVEDMTTLRRIDSLTLSPDKRRFAILVRRADPRANVYHSGWFVGAVGGGALTYVGDAGDARLAREGPGGSIGGSIERRAAKWSPNGLWIAHTSLRNGEVQLWRSRTDGSGQEQVTHNPADVREFSWSEDSELLYFTVGSPRAELRASEQQRERNGYRYDEDLNFFGDLLLPERRQPLDKARVTWVTKSGVERLANDEELAAFKVAQERDLGGGGLRSGLPRDAVLAAVRSDAARAWLARSDDFAFRVTAVLPQSENAVACMAEPCAGLIEKLWWHGQSVLFLRREGVGGGEVGLYRWSPGKATVSTVVHTLDDMMQFCDLAPDRLVCARQTPGRPAHVAAIDLRSGRIAEIADVNPEFRNVRLGRIERFEWQTPRFPWAEPGQPLAGVYPERTYGYILYPPDFDASKKYPVYMDVYSALGFDNESTYENPLHVYAANGILVLHTQFPTSNPLAAPVRRNPEYAKLPYSVELDFPHLSMYAESTLRGLDVAAARGFIDTTRVGMGGVSHGSFVPLHIVLKHDRLAAVSIASPGWNQWEYLQATRAGLKTAVPIYKWLLEQKPAGHDIWKHIDLADNIDSIEAPLLIQTPASEMMGQVRLMKHMAEAGKPYDAYVFTNETHIKWQPAHLQAIAARNLDWFRFWLQGYEDPDPAKSAQYQRWRQLREQQQATGGALKE